MKHIYELHTAVWLNKLSTKYLQPMTLANVPDEELEHLAALHMDTVWLMGVWERSPLAAQVSLQDPALMEELRQNMPDLTNDQVIGSAYAVKSYTVDARFGGNEALALLRGRLARHGLTLLLDFVPNHTAFDNSWVSTAPHRYITTPQQDPTAFGQINGTNVAYAKDPQFAPWRDVAQLNVFNPDCVAASRDALLHVATMCDGVRCDMAMLVLNRVFSNTWGALAGPVPTTEYWQALIGATKQAHPSFTFIAEAYWDTQAELINLGFDYVYDKTLYDYLVQNNIEAAKEHLHKYQALQNQLLHFLENHDEPRAAHLFPDQQQIDFAALLLTLPGATLWHNGQFEGYKIKASVHTNTTPTEPVNYSLLSQYTRLLHKQ